MNPDGAAGRTAVEIAAYLAGGQEDSSRVTLNAITADDRDEFVELTRASKDLHHPWMTLPSTPAEFRTYLHRFDHVNAQGLLIRVRETGAAAGVVNINSIIRGRMQGGSLGYAAFAPNAGHGYMTEGLGMVVRYAFHQLRLHRLEAQIQPDNQASLALVRRLGFHYEGLSPNLLFIDGAWRDHQRWSITTTMLAPGPWPTHPTLPAR
ncbi:GNAT family N-acetyltransferase [Spongiactinospora sp. TRM90649]|uniref:GNAT family N-acetyltransferase n=1 Tax=Spongiactinospora sp. TRM90649 TaxID=3031114 RepID=UPI0023F8EF66|nr:GNAT family N-acetyltransferase [Spongiactinospora sp. TRM90649]MDF5756082.1 GNAT family N-acetyltransferase [Spongiactinospora sp. TRM90649]